MNGFWLDGEVGSFIDTLKETLGGVAGRSFDMIADVSGLPPQSLSVVVLHEQSVALLVRSGMRRFAVVGAGALLKMQIRRASPVKIPRFFATMSDAEDALANIDGPLGQSFWAPHAVEGAAR